MDTIAPWRRRTGMAICDTMRPPMVRLFNAVAIVRPPIGALLQTKMPEGVLVSHFGVLIRLVRFRDGATPLASVRAVHVPKTSTPRTLFDPAGRGRAGVRPAQTTRGGGRSG